MMTLFSDGSWSVRIPLICLCLVIGSVTAALFCANPGLAGNPWKSGFPQPDPDSALHIRRIHQILGATSSLPNHDHYVAFPDGIPYPNPPLTDFLAVSAVLGFFSLFPDAHLSNDAVMGFIPPFIGAFLAVFLFLSAREYFGRTSFGLLAVFSWWWWHHFPFWFLSLDHHCLEFLFLGILLFSGFRTFSRPSLSPGILLLGGGACSGLILSAPASPLWIGALTAYVSASMGIRFWRSEEAALRKRFEAFLANSITIGAGFSCLIVWAFLSHSFGGGFGQVFGMFQPVFALFCGLFLLLLRSADEGKWKQGICCIGLALAVWLSWNQDLLPLMGRVTNFFLSRHPYFEGISELMPGVSLGALKTNIQRSWAAIGWWLPCLPLLLIYWPKHRPGESVVRQVALLFVCLAVFSRRYAEPAQLMVSFLFAPALFGVLRQFFRSQGKEHFRAFTLSLALVLVIPLHSAVEIRRREIPKEYFSVESACKWLRENSPETSGFFGAGIPEYGILTDHNWGHHLPLLARRPGVACPIQAGLKPLAEILLATSEETAFSKCRERKLKYLFMAYPEPDIQKTLQELLVSDFIGPFLNPVFSGSPASETATFFGQDLFFSLGFSGNKGPCHFRTIYLSPFLQNSTNFVKIFEVVPGAFLEGKAPPLATVSVELPIDLVNPPGRILYQRREVADESGKWQVRIAYPTNSSFGGGRTGNAYSITWEGLATPRTLEVPEPAVRGGTGVRLEEPSSSK